MFIHHVATVVLLFFAWKCHLFRIFMVALVLLDCSDVLLEVLVFPVVIKSLESCFSCPKL
jgi:hypothetical protein